MTRDWIVYGSELSPFTLKVLAMCRYRGVPYRFLPADGSWLDNIRISIRKARLTSGRLPLTWPQFTEDDEYPLVPFLFGPEGENLYDSTAIGEWLDERFPSDIPLIPTDPAHAFLVRLLDEFADEWMLYLVHHFRWKVSAADNNAGHRLARELRTLTFGWDWPVEKFFSARQVRRMPYLFSVPATHALLEESYRRILLALEDILGEQPYLFGGAPTLADFSLYGEIGMNLADPSANDFIARTAPHTHHWVQHMHQHDFPRTAQAQYHLSAEMKPLFAEVCRVYVPLMQQNAAAVERFRAAGERRFNEKAFDAGRCLYDGEIDGTPFRSVAKTFQAKTWRSIVAAWNALDAESKRRIEDLLPANHGLPG